MNQSDDGATRRHIVGLWGYALWWAVLFALWLALVGKAATLELLVGAVSAAVATVGAALVRERDHVRFAVTPDQLLRVARPLPMKVARDCATLASALGARLSGQKARGHTREIPFQLAARSDPLDASREALVVAGISLAPNTYVVDVDRDHSLLLVHDLVARPHEKPEDRKWPL